MSAMAETECSTVRRPFLSLPAEMRLMIYEAFFRSAKFRTRIPWRSSTGSMTISDPVSDNASILNGLLLANKQIRGEALPFLYKYLVVHLDAALAHMHSVWSMIKPRMAASDLSYFRSLVQRVDLGVVTFHHASYTCMDVGDLNLASLEHLRRIDFRLVVSEESAKYLFMTDEDQRSPEIFDKINFATVLQTRWCEDSQRCFGLRERMKHVRVRVSRCGTGRFHLNRFVSGHIHDITRKLLTKMAGLHNSSAAGFRTDFTVMSAQASAREKRLKRIRVSRS